MILCISPNYSLSESLNIDKTSIKIGFLLTMSGTFALAGSDCQKGINAAIEMSGSNGQINPIFADSKNDPVTAIAEFRKLTRIDGSLAVFAYRSTIGMPINSISYQDKVPVLGVVGHKDYTTANPYAFQVWPRSDQEGSFIAESIARQGLKRVAMVVTEDEWTSAVADGFKQRLEDSDIELVGEESVLLAERDFRTVLLRIKKHSPDVIFLNLLLPQIGIAVKQIRELGLAVEMFSNFYTASKEVVDIAGDSLEGVKYVEMNTELPKLKKHLEVQPEDSVRGLTVASYVATYLIAQALEKLEGQFSSKTLYQAFLKQKEIRTPDLTYPITNRQVRFPLVLKEIRQGKGGLSTNHGQ